LASSSQEERSDVEERAEEISPPREGSPVSDPLLLPAEDSCWDGEERKSPNRNPAIEEYPEEVFRYHLPPPLACLISLSVSRQLKPQTTNPLWPHSQFHPIFLHLLPRRRVEKRKSRIFLRNPVEWEAFLARLVVAPSEGKEIN
jgi:hypothetical protein